MSKQKARLIAHFCVIDGIIIFTDLEIIPISDCQDEYQLIAETSEQADEILEAWESAQKS